MALATAAGINVALITCTLGELGEVIPPELSHLEGDYGALATHRADELERACAALGVADHRLLGGRRRWHDSGMIATGNGVRAAAPARVDSGAFSHREVFREQVDQLATALRDGSPTIVITYDASGGYGHPDHVRAHEITASAVEAVDPAAKHISLYAVVIAHDELAAGLEALRGVSDLPFPVPPVEDLASVPDASVTIRVPLGQAQSAKLSALRAHGTQVSVLDKIGPPAFVLSNGIAQPVLPAEHFTLLRGPDGALDALLDL